LLPSPASGTNLKRDPSSLEHEAMAQPQIDAPAEHRHCLLRAHDFDATQFSSKNAGTT
jgi:hypothetical protein